MLYADGAKDDLSQHAESGNFAAGFECGPAKIFHHRCHTASVAVSMGYIPGSSALDTF